MQYCEMSVFEQNKNLFSGLMSPINDISFDYVWDIYNESVTERIFLKFQLMNVKNIIAFQIHNHVLLTQIFFFFK